ncbi:hypothetical protein AHAS_Ahas05G0101900 [Arachis hypogaea]
MKGLDPNNPIELFHASHSSVELSKESYKTKELSNNGTYPLIFLRILNHSDKI